MAIDVMTRKGTPAIIVGDDADMRTVTGLYVESDRAFLLFGEDDQADGHRVSLSDAAFRNLEEDCTVVLFVALSPEDAITEAFRCRSGLPYRLYGTRLDEPEIKTLAEDLVSGDFNLDFLR